MSNTKKKKNMQLVYIYRYARESLFYTNWIELLLSDAFYFDLLSFTTTRLPMKTSFFGLTAKCLFNCNSNRERTFISASVRRTARKARWYEERLTRINCSTIVGDYLASFIINTYAQSLANIWFFSISASRNREDSHDADDNLISPMSYVHILAHIPLCLFLPRVVTHLSGFRACHHCLCRDSCHRWTALNSWMTLSRRPSGKKSIS